MSTDTPSHSARELSTCETPDLSKMVNHDQQSIPDASSKEKSHELGHKTVQEAPTMINDLSILKGLKVGTNGIVQDHNGKETGRLVNDNAENLSEHQIDKSGKIIHIGNLLGECEILQDIEKKDSENGQGGNEQNKRSKLDADKSKVSGEFVEKSLDQDVDSSSTPKKGITGQDEEVNIGDKSVLPPLSILKGLKVNKLGKIVDIKGSVVGELTKGDAKTIFQSSGVCDSEGRFWDNQGHIIGEAKTININETQEAVEGVFAGLKGLIVNSHGMIEDGHKTIVGKVSDGDTKELIGLVVDEDGDILDKRGSVIGHGQRYEESKKTEDVNLDLSLLAGKTVNKIGYVVDSDGSPIGRLIEGNAKESNGRKCDENGFLYNDSGKVVGKCELLPENERIINEDSPFAGFEGLHVVKEGMVEDQNGNVVGKLISGDEKRLIGHAVDEDGDVTDRYGNIKGHAELYQEEEKDHVDLKALDGGTVNKLGNVVDEHGHVIGRVIKGDLENMKGRKVDEKGQIWNNSGKVIGQAELVEKSDIRSEGPFAGVESSTVSKDGVVKTSDGAIVGRVVEGNLKQLTGYKVDEDGDILDKNGNSIGKAERWEPEEKSKQVNIMSGHRVNKQGEIRDNDGELIGKVTLGDLGRCIGLEIDDNGNIIDNDGNKVGEATISDNITEESNKAQEQTPEEKKKQEDAELAEKMANICQSTIDRIQPVLRQITEADRTPRDELDEDELVNNVKPLIEEGARTLQGCNEFLRGLDPDGHIAAQAKGRAASREATPQEYRLADLLKELTQNVVKTIDNAKNKLSNMPHAEKKLNPLWSLLTEPLFQILAAVGLLLSGVLGLVGRLLNALGLGSIVNSLLGGLGIDKLLGGLGLGSVTEMLGGKKNQKKSVVGSIPLVGGLLGGGK